MSNGNAVSEGLFKKLPYDTLKDLTPVSTLGFFDLGVFVENGSRFSTLQQLLQYAKAQPDALKVGTIAVGSTQHLASQLFQSMAGVDMLDVPYRGSPAVLLALRRGEIDVALEILGPMLPHVKSGVVRVLALTGDRPNPALPSAPTVRQAGPADYSVSSWNAIAVPTGTPPALVARLNEAAQKALASPEVRAKLESLGVRVQGSTPEQAHTLVASEIKRWAQVIRAAKIEPQ
jgi:tripartite-type tricarboxylate transporter receptor subunit TctC